MVVTEHLQHTGCHWSVIRLLVIGISEVYHQIQNSWSTIKLYLAILFFPALSTVWGRQDCNGPFYKSPDNCCIASWSNGQGFKATDIAFILLSQKWEVFWGKIIFVQMFIVGVWKVQLQLHTALVTVQCGGRGGQFLTPDLMFPPLTLTLMHFKHSKLAVSRGRVVFQMWIAELWMNWGQKT